MSGIFISYRRDDAGDARLIVEGLKQKLGHPVSPIKPRAGSVEAIENAVGSCHVLVALIGDRWLEATDEDGQRRLDDPQDFIRLEIATALERNVKVIPVLLRGARMPRESELPEPLKAVTRRQALKVSDERWDYDMGRLAQAVEGSTPTPSPTPGPDERADGAVEPSAVSLSGTGIRSPVEFVLNGLKNEFVKIPAGEFDMGSNFGYRDEKPVRKVRISKPFQMGKYEVTQEQWKAVMMNNPSSFEGARRPVENVSWEGVQEFIVKLNQRSDVFEYRLPTEAEWEYAARAGTSGDFAGNLDEIGWYEANSGNGTHPVGDKKPNAWGLHDMHGNVWEWVQDWYAAGYYGSRPNPDTDPQGPERTRRSLLSLLVDRVVRGGGWNFPAQDCRSADRYWVRPGYRHDSLGFRLLRQAR
ncbi:MAG: SUMF1/EgtB/PvdO family nonheme iron enzyme [Acidobacteriota bacterium]